MILVSSLVSVLLDPENNIVGLVISIHTFLSRYIVHHAHAYTHLNKNNDTDKKKYAFKCHRVNDTVYPVNAIAFHPTYGTFATGGADGTVVTWDANNKKKLCSIAKCPTSIACLAFNHDGTQIAMASSYTFEEGERDHPREEIYVRDVLESEVRPKAKK